MPHVTLPRAAVFVSLVALAACSRFFEVAPNFAAVAAASMFAGFYFRSSLAGALVALGAMLLSDAILGFYPDALVMIAVYGCLAAPALLGSMMPARPSLLRLGGSSLAASLGFFVVTNLAVWLSGWYAPTAEGLLAAYVSAIPFLKYTLAGDALFIGVLFGAHALLNRRTPISNAVPVPVAVAS